MSAPKRIQMSRQRPWRHEHPDAVIVARPSKWGNPWRVHRRGDVWSVVEPDGRAVPASASPTAKEAARLAVEWFSEASANGWEGVPFRGEIRAELAGKDLACWCPLDSPCHADVLLELANPTTPKEIDR